MNESNTQMRNQPEPGNGEDAFDLRLWLRLLNCTNLVLGHLGRRLWDEFDTTLPRFEILIQVHRPPRGPTMSELSQRLMVT